MHGTMNIKNHVHSSDIHLLYTGLLFKNQNSAQISYIAFLPCKITTSNCRLSAAPLQTQKQSIVIQGNWYEIDTGIYSQLRMPGY